MKHEMFGARPAALRSTLAVPRVVPRAAFEPFLFAEVGESESGLPITMMSLLARLDINPWDEAAVLSQVPPADARKRLSGLLARFPQAGLLDVGRANPDRLIPLLPRLPHEPLACATVPATASISSRTFIVFYFAFMLAMIAAQLVWNKVVPGNADENGINSAQTSAEKWDGFP